jgi:uncharacterized membrane protein
MNKKALKEVGQFWLVFLAIVSYCVGLAILTCCVSPLFFVFGLGLPAAVGVSCMVYDQSEHLEKK